MGVTTERVEGNIYEVERKNYVNRVSWGKRGCLGCQKEMKILIDWKEMEKLTKEQMKKWKRIEIQIRRMNWIIEEQQPKEYFVIGSRIRENQKENDGIVVVVEVCFTLNLKYFNSSAMPGNSNRYSQCNH